MRPSASQYADDFLASLPDEDAALLRKKSKNATASQTHVYSHAAHQQAAALHLEDFEDGANLDGKEPTVVVVENIDVPWIAALGRAWSIEPAFFAEHLKSPMGSTPWTSVFGAEGEALTPCRLRGVGSAETDRAYWHVDGVFEYKDAGLPPSEPPRDPNLLRRRCQNDCVYGWCAHTRISGHFVRPSLLLFLVDAPFVCPPPGVRAPLGDGTRLFLPLSKNRGGLFLPPLLKRVEYSLCESFHQFLSHTWHRNALFAVTEENKAPMPEVLFHLMATSTWASNLRTLTTDIEHIAYVEIRRPTIQINDRLHDCRRDLARLRAEVTKVRKWVPATANVDLHKLERPSRYIAYPDTYLGEILGGAEVADKVLVDTFQLLIGSVSGIESQTSQEQAAGAQRLTILGSIYLPLSLVTGIHGMNVKEVNGSPLSVWVPLLTLGIIAVCTALVFVGYSW